MRQVSRMQEIQGVDNLCKRALSAVLWDAKRQPPQQGLWSVTGSIRKVARFESFVGGCRPPLQRLSTEENCA